MDVHGKVEVINAASHLFRIYVRDMSDGEIKRSDWTVSTGIARVSLKGIDYIAFGRLIPTVIASEVIFCLKVVPVTLGMHAIREYEERGDQKKEGETC